MSKNFIVSGLVRLAGSDILGEGSCRSDEHIMRKYPKKSTGILGKTVAGVIVFETVAFLGAYIFWSRMNKSQEFRYKVNDWAPWALKAYYTVGKTFNSGDSTESEDRQYWNSLASVKK